MAAFGGVRTPKNNSRNKGSKLERKLRLRSEAEARQAAYDATPYETKLAACKPGSKEYNKLISRGK